MDPNAALAELRKLAKAWLDGEAPDDEAYHILMTLLEQWEALDGWLRQGGFLPADWAASTRVTPNDLHALSTITDAAIHCYRVARLMPSGDVIEGVARSIGDENGNFLKSDEDVRDGYLRVSGTFEYFWPIRELMPQIHDSTFVVQRGA